VSGIYARLVDRFYAMPPHERAAGEPLELTWAEFTEVWYDQQSADDRFNQTNAECDAVFGTTTEPLHTIPRRPPTADDVPGSRVLGAPIVIVDEYGLRTDPPPAGKLRLSGGPFNGKEIDAPSGVAWVCIPEIFPLPLGAVVFGGHRLTHCSHQYNARTGLYHKGRMSADRPYWPRPTLFGQRTERLLARLDRRGKT
jgi:hypothetical protein